MTTLVARRVALGTALAFVLATGGLSARQAPPQPLDQEYGKRIKDNTPDARILTDLIDHMPISDTVPSPLKFLGYIPGENNRITYHKDIVRYLGALDKDQRDAFVLTQVLGLSYEEAAEVCECPIGTIRSRVARARQDLMVAVRIAEAR